MTEKKRVREHERAKERESERERECARETESVRERKRDRHTHTHTRIVVWQRDQMFGFKYPAPEPDEGHRKAACVYSAHCAYYMCAFKGLTRLIASHDSCCVMFRSSQHYQTECMLRAMFARDIIRWHIAESCATRDHQSHSSHPFKASRLPPSTLIDHTTAPYLGAAVAHLLAFGACRSHVRRHLLKM